MYRFFVLRSNIDLTDHPALVEALSDRIVVGSVLSDLLVLNKDDDTHRCMVSRKKTLVDAARAGQLPSKLAQVKQGTVIPVRAGRDVGCIGHWVRLSFS